MRSLSLWMAVSLALIAAPAVAQNALTISGAAADPARNTIAITGTGFEPANIVVYVGAELADMRQVRVITATETSVSARLPAQQPGTYVVGVSSGTQSAATTYILKQATAAASGAAGSNVLLAAQFVDSGLRLIRDYALPLLLAFAGVGVITMAVIQAIKDLFPVRQRFHQRHIKAWLEGRSGSAEATTLVALAAAGNAKALFELPVAGMMGQLTMASRVVLLFPKQYAGLLRVMAGTQSEDDITTILTGTPADDVERARVRVGHMIERTIDALQISISSRWEWGNKLAAFVLSAVVTAASFWVYFYATDEGVPPTLRLLGLGAVTSVLGGFVAPVAKDLVTALQSLKKP